MELPAKRLSSRVARLHHVPIVLGRTALIVMDLCRGRRWAAATPEDSALAEIPVVVFSARPSGDLPDVVCARKDDPGALLELIDRHSLQAGRG